MPSSEACSPLQQGRASVTCHGDANATQAGFQQHDPRENHVPQIEPDHDAGAPGVAEEIDARRDDHTDPDPTEAGAEKVSLNAAWVNACADIKEPITDFVKVGTIQPPPKGQDTACCLVALWYHAA